MKQEIIFSNRKWVQFYEASKVIYILIFITMFWLRTEPGNITASPVYTILMYISLIFLMLTSFYDLTKPRLIIELMKKKDELILRQYLPSIKNLIGEPNDNVNIVNLKECEKFTHKIYNSRIPLFNKIEFFAENEKNEVFKTKKINFLQLTLHQENTLKEIVQSKEKILLK